MNHAPRYAVIGDPVEHSLSPLIHTEFARQTGITLDYQKLRVPQGEFENCVNQFFVDGGCGLNVTSPLKELAFNYADVVSNHALNAGAVNTLKYFDEDIVYGDNTDGAGLIVDLQQNLNTPVCDSRILVLGAGGAARGCLEPLLRASPAALYLYNRTASRAQELIDRFAHLGEVALLPTEHTGELIFDLVINATSASVTGTRPDIDHRYLQGALCYDMMYGQKALGFLKWASAQGARSTHDGLGMLVEQAAESFRIWHDVRPDTRQILSTLKQTVAVKSR